MKTVDIETLLRWAYREELPKAAVERAAPMGRVAPAGHRNAYDAVARAGELLAVIQEPDVVNRYGVLPLLDRAPDDPHPDAIAVSDAVEALAKVGAYMPEGWSPLSDMGDLGPEGEAAIVRGMALLTTDALGGHVQLRRPLSRLVIRHALLGGEPVWQAERPERRTIMEYGRAKWFRRITMVTDGAFGPATYEVEIDGFDFKRRRPYADAYRKVVLVPDPAEVVRARAEYELWHGALVMIAEDLAGAGLVAHRVTPPARPSRPWEGEPTPGPRILPSLQFAPDGQNGNVIAA